MTTNNPAPVTTSDAERAALLPCPFCGASASGYAIEPHSHALTFGGVALPDHPGSYVIEGDCGCGSGLLGATQEEVTERWNSRAHPTALRIDFKQATELLAMFGGEPGEVTLLTGEGRSGRGLYAHAAGHGEDGAQLLGEPTGWQPIATAPKDEAVLVYTPPQDGDWPDSVRFEIDCLRSEDDAWHNHSEHYEHFMMIGGSRAAGPDMVCTGPAEQAPYTHWLSIPAVPKHPSPQSEEGSLFLGVADGDAVTTPSGERDQSARATTPCRTCRSWTTALW